MGYRYEDLIEMDSITKWLVRIASVMIILTCLTLALAVPVIAFTINSKLSVAQDSFKSTLELLIEQVLT